MQLILKSTSAFVRLPREVLSLPERANTASAAVRVAASASLQGLLPSPCSAMARERPQHQSTGQTQPIKASDHWPNIGQPLACLPARFKDFDNSGDEESPGNGLTKMIGVLELD